MSNPAPLRCDTIYHIYNRGNNGENVFIEERNYRYFLQLYIQHVHPAVETYAYCLLRNHFHLLVRVKPGEELSKHPSRYFANLFNAYAKAINKAYGRTGALFERPFQRIEVAEEAYFVRLVTYIHLNPKRHRFVDDFRQWPYSSYHALRGEKRTHLQRDVVLDWFGGRAEFARMHEAEDLSGLHRLPSELLETET